MMGVKNSVASRLKQVLPNIFIMKCICHTFHLCASYACKTLPQELEQVTREVYNYFANSPKRVNEYKQFQEFAKVSPVKILHPSQTRWLSLLGVVKRLLSRYNALVLFFTDQSNENITQAKNILEILVKPQTKLYLEFLAYILPTFHNLNLVMQSESPKIHLIYKEVSLAVKTILECYVLEEKIENASFSDNNYENPHNFLKIEHMYFGVSIQASNSNEHILHEVKATCLAFYVEAVKQILTRFPLKDSIFAHLEFIDPQVVISRRIMSIAHIARYFPSLCQDWQTVDNEWRQLRNWGFKNSNDNENAFEFWREVGEKKLGNGEKKFAHLVDLVFNVLCLPHSSANVERISSQVNLNKTSTRNKLKTNTLEGLLHTKNLVSKNYNCFNFPISSDLVKKSTSSALYATEDAASSSNAISTNSDDDIEIE